MYTDKTLTCRDCGTQFSFTASEQAFFAEKGFTNQPGRCPSCRATNRNGGGSRGAGSRGGYGQERQMHDVVCAECGRNTQVPFLPTSDRPVYCSDCFRNHNPRGR
ncbi:MAG TPA: zinc-ribbon domain containing protein [Candidatus Limnocylindria bacterium]|nr:zinc-ribbon domain containing protein [Candidatus Limnocylindria bacterium]